MHRKRANPTGAQAPNMSFAGSAPPPPKPTMPAPSPTPTPAQAPPAGGTAAPSPTAGGMGAAFPDLPNPLAGNPEAAGQLYAALGPAIPAIARATGGLGLYALNDLLVRGGRNARAFLPRG